MSAMSELALDIEKMLNEGFSPRSISAVLEVPVSWVYEVADTMECSEKTTENTADFG